MHNTEIRKAIDAAGLRYWQVAEELGVADTTFTKWLRKELPDEKRIQVMAAIEKLSDK